MGFDSECPLRKLISNGIINDPLVVEISQSYSAIRKDFWIKTFGILKDLSKELILDGGGSKCLIGIKLNRG